VKCGLVPQNEIANLEGKAAATTTLLKSPESAVKSLSTLSLSLSNNGVYFLS